MQGFGHGTRLADCGDEVDVAEPTRQDVHVKVTSHAGTGGFAQIHSDVEAVRVIDLCQCGLSAFREVHHFISDLFVAFIEVGDVLERKDHQMTGAVGINIQDDKIKLGPTEDEIFLVAGRVA